MCYLLRSCWHPWIKKVREKYLPHVTSCEWLVTRGFSMQQLAGAVAGTRGENFQWNSRRVFLMFKKRNSGRWQRKVGLHLSDRFSTYHDFTPIDTEFTTEIQVYWESIFVVLPCFSGYAALFGLQHEVKVGGFSPISLHPKLPLLPPSSVHPYIHPSLPPGRRSGYASQMIAPRLRIISVQQCLLDRTKSLRKVLSEQFLFDVELIDTKKFFQWNELCGTFCLSQGPASTSLDWSFG